MPSIIIGSLYKHFKGHIYEVIAVAKHSETGEEMVVYKDASAAFGGEKVWVRPAKMWDENVSRKEGDPLPRFKIIEDDNREQK